MLVSWNWLKEYVSLEMPLAELEDRLAMSGLTRSKRKIVAVDDEVVTRGAAQPLQKPRQFDQIPPLDLDHAQTPVRIAGQNASCSG